MTMRQEVNVLIFFITCSKREILKKKLKFNCSIVFSWASLVFYLMLDMSKMWLAKFLTTIFTKINERFNLYMFNVIYM